MLSSNLGDLLATMDVVGSIDGVKERDNAVVEARKSREGRFLDQVMGLAQVPVEEATAGRTGTKYSDGEIQLDFDDQDYAKTIMDLAKAQGIAAGEIVPSRLQDGGVRLSVMPHVFASTQMEVVRAAIDLGIEEGVYEDYSALVTDLVERKNRNHAITGKFTSNAVIGTQGGSRSFQFSAPKDNLKSRKFKHVDGQTYNQPGYRTKGKAKQFKVRKTPCGRAARPYFRKLKGLPPLKPNKWYLRCHDGAIPDWSIRKRGPRKPKEESFTMVDSKRAAKEMLVASLRENKSRSAH